LVKGLYCADATIYFEYKYLAMFDKEIYLQRRDYLTSKMGTGSILLLGNDEVGMNYQDNIYHFRQDSTFLYYLGVDRPGLAATIDVNSGNTTIFGTNPTIDDIVWTGPQKLLEDFAAESGVTDARPYSELNEHISSGIAEGEIYHFIPPYRYKHTIQLAEIFEKPVSWVKESFSLELTKSIVKQRLIKGPEEVDQLDKAATITANMHQRAMEFATPGMKEQDVMAEVYKVALAEGPGISFPPIVSVRGEVLHNHSYTNTLHEGQMLLVDSGGESSLHYAGDMTRTFPVSHAFSAKQAAIYSIVLDAEKKSADAIGPGVSFKEVHLLAARTIVEGLKSLGLMTGDPEEAVKEGGHALFFPHGLGHMMGLDVHDMEN